MKTSTAFAAATLALAFTLAIAGNSLAHDNKDHGHDGKGHHGHHGNGHSKGHHGHHGNGHSKGHHGHHGNGHDDHDDGDGHDGKGHHGQKRHPEYIRFSWDQCKFDTAKVDPGYNQRVRCQKEYDRHEMVSPASYTGEGMARRTIVFKWEECKLKNQGGKHNKVILCTKPYRRHTGPGYNPVDDKTNPPAPKPEHHPKYIKFSWKDCKIAMGNRIPGYNQRVLCQKEYNPDERITPASYIGKGMARRTIVFKWEECKLKNQGREHHKVILCTKPYKENTGPQKNLPDFIKKITVPSPKEIKKNLPDLVRYVPGK